MTAGRGPHAIVRLAAVTLLAALAGQGCGSDGIEPGQSGGVFGTITAPDGDPLPGVIVSSGDFIGRSDERGVYSLNNVPVGEHTLTATREGYQPHTATVTIPPADMIQYDFSMARTPPTPEGAPEAVTRISARSGTAQGSVHLDWDMVANTSHGYSIYWSTSPSVTHSTGTRISPVTPPFEHTGLTPGATYYYIVTGLNADDEESRPSPEVHAVALGSVNVVIVAPSGLIDGAVSVEALIQSTFSISEVTATIGDVTAPMAFDPPSGHWRTVLSLAGKPSPASVVVQVSARDVNGNIGEASNTARLDRRPALTVAAPVNGEVVRPTAALRVTCSDDSPAGCLSLTVVEEEQGTTLFSSQGGTVNTTISLAQYAGRQIFLLFRTVDEAGQVVETPRYVFVETTPGLTQVASARSGVVIDADADRLLVDNRGFGEFLRPGGDTARIVTRGSGASTTIFADPGSTVQTGALTADGAVLVTEQLARAQVRQFRNGTLSTVTDANFIDDFEAEGEFAAWLELDVPGATRRLVWRDLAAGTSDVVVTDPLLPTAAADLAPNGDLVYVRDGEVFRFRGGASQQVTDNAAAGLQAFSARTDGTLIVQAVGPAGGGGSQLVLLDPAGDLVLASAGAGQALDARLNNGWIAFTRYDIGGVAQIWERAPNGTETQLTFFGSSLTLRLVNESGEVVFGQFPTSDAIVGLYRASPTSAAEQVVTSKATPVYIGGVLHAMFGASLFRVE